MNICRRTSPGARWWLALKSVTALLWVLSWVAAYAAGPDVLPQKRYAKVAAALEQFIQREMKDKQLPAFSIALVDDQQIVWSKGFGYADPQRKTPAAADTIYRIGSVSKLFTDIGIMQLVEQGKVDLDMPVSTYLPEFQPKNQFGKPITLRQLMSHRAGLLREPPVGHYFDPTEPCLADTVKSLNGQELVYPPETRVKYSNAGIAVVGYVLQVIEKKPFTAYLKDAVLKPMGLEDSAFEPEPAIQAKLAKAYLWSYAGKVFEAPKWQLGMAPAGSMYSSVNDLGRFMSVLFAGGRGPHGPVIKPESLTAMWTPQFPKAGGPRQFGIGFVLGQLDGHRLVGHGGAVYGFATEIELLPDDKIGAVTVTTMDSANPVVSHVANEALRLMLALKTGKLLPEIPVTQPILLEQLRKLADRYGEGEGAFDLIQKKNDLYLYFVRGGYEMKLRQLGDSLIVDDRLGYGLKLQPVSGGIKLNNKVYNRAEKAKAASLPEEWKRLIGEYGWDHNILYLSERDGKLTSLIEWYEYEPLEPVAKDVFRYPTRGLYDNENFTFLRDASGKVTAVKVGGVVFKRRTTVDEANKGAEKKASAAAAK